MRNHYSTHSVIITDIENQNSMVKLFTLKPDNKKDIKCITDDKRMVKCWWPGQFILLSIPGFGEAPFAVCSSPTSYCEFQICVQKKGSLTSKLFGMSVGDKIYFRGPYGNGFPVSKMPKRNLLFVTGGLGLVPLRPLIQLVSNRAAEFGRIQLFSGCREEKMLLFRNEYENWRKNIELSLTLDIANENWTGCTGLVTALFDKVPIAKNPVVIICGPPVMFSSVISRLKKKGVPESDIYVLLERRMHCGIGACQHCVLVNGKYVCKDGPVFNYVEIKDRPGSI